MPLIFVAVAHAADEYVYDRIWSYANLYENSSNMFIQRFVLSGRLQIDAAWFDADQGYYNDLLWRRFRFGFKTEMFQNWVLHIEGDWDFNENLGDTYSRITDAYVGWHPLKGWNIKLFKQSAGFTLDGETSSTKLLTVERNNLTNNLWFTPEYYTGISITGKADEQWTGKAGMYSSDGSDEISGFRAAFFTLLSLGRNFAGNIGLDTALVRIDYVYNEEDEDADTRDFSHVVSLVSKWEKNQWGLMTDITAGWGYGGQSDLWGFVVMPVYDVSSRIQLVFRYTYLKSTDENGVRLNRYEDRIVGGRGDEYNEVYGGLNVFIYGHKLKWQTGLQYSDMADGAADGGEYKGWGITTGLRIYW